MKKIGITVIFLNKDLIQYVAYKKDKELSLITHNNE